MEMGKSQPFQGGHFSMGGHSYVRIPFEGNQKKKKGTNWKRKRNNPRKTYLLYEG